MHVARPFKKWNDEDTRKGKLIVTLKSLIDASVMVGPRELIKIWK